MGGVNKTMAVMLMVKKFDVPIVLHSGAVGLPGYTQHLSTSYYLCVSGNLSVLEYVDIRMSIFVHPAVVEN